MDKPTGNQARVLAVLAEATEPMGRRAIALALGHRDANGLDHRTLTALKNRGWATGSFTWGFTISDTGRTLVGQKKT